MIIGGWSKWGDLEKFSDSGADFPVIYSRSFLGKKRKIGKDKMEWIAKNRGTWPLFIVHFAPIYNLAANSMIEHDECLMAIEEDYADAVKMGASHFVVHPGRHKGDRQLAINQFLSSLKNIGGEAVVCIENQPGAGREIGNLEEVIGMGYPICLDYSHAISEGRSINEIKKVDAEIYEVSNPGTPDRKSHVHLPLFEQIPLREITIVEGPSPKDDIETIWRWEHAL